MHAIINRGYPQSSSQVLRESSRAYPDPELRGNNTWHKHFVDTLGNVLHGLKGAEWRSKRDGASMQLTEEGLSELIRQKEKLMCCARADGGTDGRLQHAQNFVEKCRRASSDQRYNEEIIQLAKELRSSRD